MGLSHTAILAETGQLYVCGSNGAGQLGINGGFVQYSPVPISMPDGVEVSYVAAADTYTAAVTKEGALYTWGGGEDGRLGHPEPGNLSIPTRIKGLSARRVVKVGCGMKHMCALDDQGGAWSWGSAAYGQLGVADVHASLTPVELKFAREEEAEGIFVGNIP